MRKFLPVLFVGFLLSFSSIAQNFSNKGKEFFLCFPNHVHTSTNNQATLSIFITSDQASSGTITMANGFFSAVFNLTAANGFFQEIQILPVGTPPNSPSPAQILSTESNVVGQKSIKVLVNTGQPAVVVYAQQWAGARTAATLVLPSNVLGKKYIATSYTQNGSSNGAGHQAKSQFQVIAVKPATTVQVTPRFNGVIQPSFTIVLPNVGDIYQYQPTSLTTDITGTIVESIASGSGGCLPVAVFSGSSNLTIGSTVCTGNSYDPLWQQMYPTVTLGKMYGFIPFVKYNNGNFYRVIASEANTQVFVNSVLVATLVNVGDIYPNTFTSNPILITNPSLITADKPIAVAHYAQAQACAGGQTNLGDPDMVMLNSIEQNINDITVFSSNTQAITNKYINILLPTNGVSSFRISNNGGPLIAPLGTWLPFSPLPGYSYLRENISTATTRVRLLSDSGFNAIAYGFGAAESYAYSAGTNVRDFNSSLEIQSQYGIINNGGAYSCSNSPFKFNIYLPDSSLSNSGPTAGTNVLVRFDSLKWNVTSASNFNPNNFPVVVLGTVAFPPTYPNPVVPPDSVNIRNNKPVAWYSLNGNYTINTPGSYTVTVTGYRTNNNDGCASGNETEYTFPLSISGPPAATFTFTQPGCPADPIQFTETTPQTPYPTYRFWWSFYDPANNTTVISTVRNPVHVFNTAGTKTIRFVNITTPGCLSDTISQQIIVPDFPSATLSGTNTLCINSAPTDITFTGSEGTSPYVFSYHINTGPIQTINSTGTIASLPINTTVAGTYTYYLDSIKNQGSSICNQPQTGSVVVNIMPDATVALSSPSPTANQTVCINNPITNITYAVGGSGTGGNVSGLPAGVTGTYASGVITISGSPTINGTFNYTVSTTGPCANPTINGTLNVTEDATIALSSPAPTASQTICINTQLTNITYTVGGSGTGGSVTGLPTGVTGTFMGGVITITGTPTVSGTFNYTVITSGPCITPTLTGIINVTPDATIALSSPTSTANQTVCINNAITNITYAVGASGTGGNVSGLPSGVTGTYASGVITISGSPNLTGVFNYTVSTTGPCVNPTITGTITVNPDASITLTSGSGTINQILCNIQPIIPITYQISGGGTGATVSGLPTGVTGTYSGNVFTISGTATVSGLFNYTVTTTGTCVQNIATGSILVHPKPTASFTTVGPYCSQLEVTFTPAFGITPTGSITSWVWDYGDGAGPQIRTNGNPFTVTYSTAGVKPVSFKTISDNGCESNLFMMNVTINSKPKAGFINPAACLADANAQFTDTSRVAGAGASIVYWEWDFGDGSPPFAGSGPSYQNPLHAYAAVGQKTVRLIVTTNSGCKDTVIQNFFINGEVTRAHFIVQNPSNLCSNRPVQIKENSVVNVGGLIRTDIYWDYLNAPTVFDQDNSPTPGKIYTHYYPNLQTDQVYRIRYFAYSGFNGVCQKDTIMDITVRASPVAQFTAVPDACLYGGPIVLNQGSASGGTGVYMGPGVTFSGGVYTFNPLAAGVVTGINNSVIYTVTSPAGCDSAKVQQIKVLAPPVVNSFAPISNTCHNNAITFHQEFTAGDGTVIKWIYNWNDGNPVQTMSTGADITHVYTTTGTHTATITLETDYGCKSFPYVATFTVNPLPVPDYTFSSTACLPSADISFTNTTPSPANYTYLWSFELPSTSSANTSTLTNPIYSYTSQGPFSTSLIATNITTGCFDTSAIKIIDNNIIHPEPVLQFTAIPDVCLNNGTVQLTQASETSGMSGGPGVYSGLGVSATGLFNPLTAGVGTHTITYTWTSSFNCPATATKTVKVLAPPVVNTFTISGNKCENTAITFQNTVTQGAGVINTWIYDWGDGSAVMSVPNGNNVTHTYLLPGTYTATLYVITDGLCKSAPPLPLQVTVNPLPRPNFTYSDTACLPFANVLFKNTTPNISDWAYNWNFDFPSTNPADMSNQQQNVTHIYTNLGPHSVKLTATSGITGCTKDTIKPVTTIHPAPLANFRINKPTICTDQSITVTDLSNLADGSAGTWMWNFGDNSAIAQGRFQPPHTYTTKGTFNIKLTVTNSLGCKDDTVQSVIVYPYAVVDAGPRLQVLQGESVVLQASASGNDLQYLWTANTPATYLNNTTILQPVSTPVQDVLYTLSVTARGGCVAKDTVFVKVLKYPDIPNTFTPNNDGIHDFWEIKYLKDYPDNRVQVFTRTGQLVFESRGYTTPWDGNMKGKSLPFDTYYYIIEPGSGRRPYTGYVTIVK